MKTLSILLIAFVVLQSKSCHLKLNISPKLSSEEEQVLSTAKDSFQAETVDVRKVEENDTVMQSSLAITLVNCKRVNLNDKLLRDYCENIVDHLLAATNYGKKYDEIEIGFEEYRGWWLYNKSQTKSFVFTQSQMDEVINQHLGPGKVLTRRINQLSNNGYYRDMISLGDSLQKLGPSYIELGAQAEATAYLYLGDSLTALKYFLLAKASDPENSNNYVNITLVYSKMHNYKLAISNMDTALGLEPRNALFYYLRGQYYHAANNDKNACRDVEKASALGYSKASALALYYCK